MSWWSFSCYIGLNFSNISFLFYLKFLRVIAYTKYLNTAEYQPSTSIFEISSLYYSTYSTTFNSCHSSIVPLNSIRQYTIFSPPLSNFSAKHLFQIVELWSIVRAKISLNLTKRFLNRTLPLRIFCIDVSSKKVLFSKEKRLVKFPTLQNRMIWGKRWLEVS